MVNTSSPKSNSTFKCLRRLETANNYNDFLSYIQDKYLLLVYCKFRSKKFIVWQNAIFSDETY